MTKRRGPKTDPCGTPLVTAVQSEGTPLTMTLCLLPANQFSKPTSASFLPTNRAISILVAFSKIIEKAAANRLLTYFIEKNFFSEFQFAYTPGLSTVDAIFNFVDDVYNEFDCGNNVIGVFLDLSKAFDSLNRDILFKKLEHYGVRGVELKWFKSYLSNRAHCVKNKNVRSDVLVSRYGVPQGSIIGPIMFIIFINDIVRCSNRLKFSIYADDTCIWTSNNDVLRNVEVMNNELVNVSKWVTSNCLTLNKNKCEFVLFKRRNKIETIEDIRICIDDVMLCRRSCTKYLGIFIDENLSWDVHINYVVRKVSKYIPILYNVRSNLSFESLKLLYNSLIYPSLLYANVVWGSACRNKLKSLKLVQKKIVRVMSFKGKYEHTGPLFYMNNMLTIDKINEYMSLIYVFKKLQINNPVFQRCIPMQYNTRLGNSLSLVVPNITSNHSRQSVRWVGSQCWNSLPQKIRECNTLNTFKLSLKLHLLEKD